MTDEEKIYGLISQAEEIQQHTIHLHDEAVKSIEEIKHVTREVRQNIQWAIKPILQSGLVQTVYIVVSALLVSLVVSVALVKGLGWYVSDMRADAAELKGKIKAETPSGIQFFDINGGVVEVQHNKVLVLAE